MIPSDDQEHAAQGRADEPDRDGTRPSERGHASPQESIAGRTISHYHVLEHLGGGGMGVVYRAEDLNLGRTVALKFLPPYLTRDESAKARFVSEARAASALDHPNICTIHEIGESDDGRLFIAMACYEGETLKKKIERGALPVSEAIEYARGIADGLRAAHEADIVHRDIKPANVIVTDRRRVKILDFGLAKMVDVSLTQSGTTLGTAAYMSPEQARGDGVDQRTDVWSLGVLLYEMVTGKRPFRGDYPAAVIYSILHDEPDPVSTARPDLPPELDRIVAKALAKNVEDRYAEIDDFLADLEHMDAPPRSRRGFVPLRMRLRKNAYIYGGASGLAALALIAYFVVVPGPAHGIDSLAVLPFDNLSGDPEQEYFAAGMHDALIGELAQIGALRVISRTSAMRYRDSDKSVSDIARELDVDGIVEASVYRSGDSVRIQIQLIQAQPEERHLWASSFDDKLRNVLALHSDVARAVAHEIRVAVTPDEEERLAAARPVDPEAHEAYLRGSYYLNQLTPESIARGLDYLHQAVEIDPGHPLSHAGLAQGYSLIASHSPNPPADAFARATAAAQRALDLDESLADAHGALATIKLYREWDWAGAEQAFKRALELNPNLAAARVHYAWFLHLFGRHAEGIAELKRGIQADPLTPVYRVWLSDMYWSTDEYDAAVKSAQDALELAPEHPWALVALGMAYGDMGRFEEAIAAHQHAAASSPRWTYALGRTYALVGRREDALRIASELEGHGPIHAWGITILYSALGEVEDAVRWVDVAYQNRHPWTPWFSSAKFEPLHGDSRFQEIMREMDLSLPGTVVEDELGERFDPAKHEAPFVSTSMALADGPLPSPAPAGRFRNENDFPIGRKHLTPALLQSPRPPYGHHGFL